MYTLTETLKDNNIKQEAYLIKPCINEQTFEHAVTEEGVLDMRSGHLGYLAQGHLWSGNVLAFLLQAHLTKKVFHWRADENKVVSDAAKFI